MKRFILSILLIAAIIGAAITVSAADKSIEAPIKLVTVYPDRAQITRLAHLNLPPGVHAILIENLPVGAIDGSFRASVSDIEGLTLLGLNYKLVQHLEAPHQKVAELERLIESIKRDEKQEKIDRLEVFNQQKRLLISLAEAAGKITTIDDKTVSLDVSQWDTAYGFISNNFRQVNDSIRTVSNELDKIAKNLNKLEKELSALRGNRQHASKTVQIDVTLDSPTDFNLALTYVAQGASWTPVYDARLNDNENINLNCFADIKQHTGEDWNDVELTFSTSRPSQGTGPGLFTPWYLAIIEYKKARSALNADYLMKQAPAEIIIRGGRGDEDDYMLDELNLGIPASVGSNAYSITFETKHKKTVASGGESVRTLIANWTMDSELSYISRPRNRQEVFRLATITNQDKAPLMPGRVSIFADSDFLGTAVISEFIAPGEEFELPFGVENNLKIERELLAEKTGLKTNFFGSSTDKMRVERTIRITLTNNDKDKRTVHLEEPIPVSQDKQVEVKLGKIIPEYASMDIQGKATWSIELAPGEEKVITIPYKIEYPAGAQIAGL